jgi:hypothetical protein
VEEEEEVGAYGSGSPIPWEDLAGEDGPVGDNASLRGPFPFHAEEDMPLGPTEVELPVSSRPST